MSARVTLALLAWLPVAAAAQDCAAIEQRALRESVGLHPPLQARVVGSGRAAFHAGPDAACRTRSVFVVPGDSLVALNPWGRWIQVRYVGRDGVRHVTWLDAARVQLSTRPAR